ncbi:hypothetical protein M9H77_07484 [Catharanthus roseus]|uniref:Uncharacterized protein n=1 Tax=Catharanthus roseus TaxID=4058 RepID=A0ACC0BV28_CATRO|nr:hypothetical protein M9H77_07484 [Catharanthus roseus]
MNSLTNESNSFLVENSLCVQASRKQSKEIHEERRHLMKFKGNFKSAKRKRPLYYEKSQIKYSIGKLFSRFECGKQISVGVKEVKKERKALFIKKNGQYG